MERDLARDLARRDLSIMAAIYGDDTTSYRTKQDASQPAMERLA